MYVYVCVCIYIYIYIYKRLGPSVAALGRRIRADAGGRVASASAKEICGGASCSTLEGGGQGCRTTGERVKLDCLAQRVGIVAAGRGSSWRRSGSKDKDRKKDASAGKDINTYIYIYIYTYISNIIYI